MEAELFRDMIVLRSLTGWVSDHCGWMAVFFSSTSQMFPITYLTPFAPVIIAYRVYAMSVILRTPFSLCFLRRIKDLFHTVDSECHPPDSVVT